MTIYKILFVISFSMGLLAMIVNFLLLLYIKKTRIKKIDKLVYGFEVPHDSIFALMIRVPNYAGAFFWPWSARRTKLDHIVSQFDDNYKKPFVAFFIMMIVAIISFLFSVVISEIYLK